MLWILFTIFAAFMQSWRNAFQNKLSKDVSVSGVTLARFLWASPIALAYLYALHLWQPASLPSFNNTFMAFVIGAATMQILATALMVVLFKQNNFAIGAGLAKSEALIAAILGVMFFGTTLTPLAGLGVLIGAIAVFLLSTEGGLRSTSLKTVFIGLACGSSFALTSLWVREASLSLDVPFPHRAAWVLFCVISLQALSLSLYLLITDRPSLSALWQRPKLTLLTSTASCLGSIGWFSAMSLQAVPYVKTLGQIEIFFTMLISVLWLKEGLRIKDVTGLLCIAIAAILVMWG
jgi:drug/metabolite transporter (DMT)-like permease